LKISSYQNVEASKAEEGAEKLRVRWLITKEIGAENFAMRLFEMDPGGFSPLHRHPWEHEVFILEGKGLAAN
jgi:quercetin dioxygenase-like cupin family protein